MKELWAWLWTNRTRTFAALQGLVAMLAGMTDTFTPKWLKILLVTNAVLTWLLGQFNSWQANRAPPAPPTEKP
jgi:hypothetical protein